MRRIPEIAHSGTVIRVFDIQMAGQHVGQTANLAPAHGIGLPGDRQWPHARFADPARGQMAIQDGIHLIGPG